MTRASSGPATIDQLAAERMILENNYVAPVCSPSRGALLTGKLAWTIGEQNTVFMPYTPDSESHDQGNEVGLYPTYMVKH